MYSLGPSELPSEVNKAAPLFIGFCGHVSTCNGSDVYGSNRLSRNVAGTIKFGGYPKIPHITFSPGEIVACPHDTKEK